MQYAWEILYVLSLLKSIKFKFLILGLIFKNNFAFDLKNFFKMFAFSNREWNNRIYNIKRQVQYSWIYGLLINTT